MTGPLRQLRYRAAETATEELERSKGCKYTNEQGDETACWLFLICGNSALRLGYG